MRLRSGFVVVPRLDRERDIREQALDAALPASEEDTHKRFRPRVRNTGRHRHIEMLGQVGDQCRLRVR